MTRRRLVLIGAGAIGRMHIERARSHPQCEIVAVADPSPQAEGFAREQGLRWFADYRSMLDAVRPEGAIFAEQFRHFAAVIAGDEAPVCSGDDAARTLAAALAVHRAVAADARVAPSI